MQKDRWSPYLTILVFIGLVNLFFSTYFISILMCGVVFKIFLEVLRKENYYFLFVVIFTFLIIEAAQGLKMFSLTLIALTIYYFIIPKIKHIFSSSIMSELIFIFFFYLGVFISTLFYIPFELDLLKVFLLNFLLDSFIVGFIL